MSGQDITISPIRDPAGKPVGWEMSYEGKKGNKPGNYPEIILAKNSGNHEFTVTINNANGIAFARGTNHSKDADNALWIEEGITSPTAKGMNSQIKDAKLQNNTQLVFKDVNNGKDITLSYRLNFSGAPPLDPIIKNGGGTGPGVASEYLVAGAVVVALFAAYFLRKLFSAKPVVRDANDAH